MENIEQQEYARYVLDLMDEEADDEEIQTDSFYGYFQMYMPSGEGVEAAFVPLQDGSAYLRSLSGEFAHEFQFIMNTRQLKKLLTKFKIFKLEINLLSQTEAYTEF